MIMFLDGSYQQKDFLTQGGVGVAMDEIWHGIHLFSIWCWCLGIPIFDGACNNLFTFTGLRY